MELDSQHVIAALRRQNTELAWRLALAEAQLAQIAAGPEDEDRDEA